MEKQKHFIVKGRLSLCSVLLTRSVGHFHTKEIPQFPSDPSWGSSNSVHLRKGPQWAKTQPRRAQPPGPPPSHH